MAKEKVFRKSVRTFRDPVTPVAAVKKSQSPAFATGQPPPPGPAVLAAVSGPFHFKPRDPVGPCLSIHDLELDPRGVGTGRNFMGQLPRRSRLHRAGGHPWEWD